MIYLGYGQYKIAISYRVFSKYCVFSKILKYIPDSDLSLCIHWTTNTSAAAELVQKNHVMIRKKHNI